MQTKETDLYFIGAEGLNFIKVGQSKNPQGRLRQLRTGSPYKLRLLHVGKGEGDLECYVLKILRNRVQTNGEWFLSDGVGLPELLALAKELRRRVPEPPQEEPAMSGRKLGAYIRLARQARGISQKDLHQATGLSQKYLSEIELDKVDPRFSIVLRIANALEISLDQLATRGKGA